MASTSQVTRARSGFSPLARNPPYIPAALNPFAAVTPPGIYRVIAFSFLIRTTKELPPRFRISRLDEDVSLGISL